MLKAQKFPLGFVLLVVATFFVPLEARAQRCVPASVRSAGGGRMAAGVCEPTPLASGLTVGRDFQLPAAQEPRRTKAPRIAGPASRPLYDPGDLRDVRFLEKQPELERLLLLEIRSVETLLELTSPRSWEYPKLLRRLADNYLELEHAAVRTRFSALARAGELDPSDAREAGVYRDRAAAAARQIAHARARAIRTYQRLAGGYPAWCRKPGGAVAERGCVDEVLHVLGHELERDGRFDEAGRAYRRLVEQHPASTYAGRAYLALGELAFKSGRIDRARWVGAARAYDRATASLPSDGALWAYARYKLAHVHQALGQFADAHAGFAAVVRFGLKHPSLPHAGGLLQAARADLVVSYAQGGDIHRAFEMFRPLSGDEGAGTERTMAMLARLGDALVDGGQHDEVIVLAGDLLRRAPSGSSACVAHAALAAATLALHPHDEQAGLRVLEEQRRRRRAFAQAGHAPDEVTRCDGETAALLVETAMGWHVQALGAEGQPGTGNAATVEAALHLYRAAVADFGEDELRRFSFARLRAVDRPGHARLQAAIGDLLRHRGDWSGCGAAFAAAHRAGGDEVGGRAALAAAATCHHRAFEAAHPVGRAVRPSPEASLSPEAQATARVLDDQLCEIALPAAVMAERRLARGTLFYEAGRFDLAAAALRPVALEAGPSGLRAASLYVDALLALGQTREAASATCLDDLAVDLPALRTAHCAGQGRAAPCEVFARLERDVGLRRGEHLLALARAAQGSAAVALHRRAAAVLLAQWARVGAGACRSGAPDCAGQERVLAGAAEALEGSGELGRAQEIREQLVDPALGLHRTEAGRRALRDLARGHATTGDFARAAVFLERFAAVSPASHDAPGALVDAVAMRLSLGQRAEALAAARRFALAFGVRRPAEAGRLAVIFAADDAARGGWTAVAARLGPASASIDRHGTLDVRLQTHALLAQAHAGLERRAAANEAYRRVLSLWSDRAREPVGDAGLGAVARAKLYFAAELHRAADAMPSGAAPAVDLRVAAIRRAVAAYQGVLAMRPRVPAAAAVAARGAIGSLWARLADDIVGAPEDEQAARRAEPYLRAAEAAYRACVEGAVMQQHFDPGVRVCERWLREHEPAPPPRLEGRSPGPTYRPDPRIDATPAVPDGR